MINKILKLIYPPVCIICNKINNEYICKKCKIKLEKDNKHINCDKIKDKFFIEHIYLFKYDGIIRKQILNYKFNEKSYIYRLFIDFLKNNENIYCKIQKYDIIMSVPISKKRLKERGYNQSSLFAREVAKILNKEYQGSNLIKIKDNLAQSTLNKEKREQNVKDAYILKNVDCIKNKKIMLIDDIYTTGNTLNECSRMLKQAGVHEVGVFTIAKD